MARLGQPSTEKEDRSCKIRRVAPSIPRNDVARCGRRRTGARDGPRIGQRSVPILFYLPEHISSVQLVLAQPPIVDEGEASESPGTTLTRCSDQRGRMLPAM